MFIIVLYCHSTVIMFSQESYSKIQSILESGHSCAFDIYKGGRLYNVIVDVDIVVIEGPSSRLNRQISEHYSSYESFNAIFDFSECQYHHFGHHDKFCPAELECSETVTCSICMVDAPAQHLCYLRCNHGFHKSCILGWEAAAGYRDMTCPMCRKVTP